jgi:hypothetical protein
MADQQLGVVTLNEPSPYYYHGVRYDPKADIKLRKQAVNDLREYMIDLNGMVPGRVAESIVLRMYGTGIYYTTRFIEKDELPDIYTDIVKIIDILDHKPLSHAKKRHGQTTLI